MLCSHEYVLPVFTVGAECNCHICRIETGQTIGEFSSRKLQLMILSHLRQSIRGPLTRKQR